MKLIKGIKKEVQRTQWLGFDDLKSTLITVILFVIVFGAFFVAMHLKKELKQWVWKTTSSEY
jgi:preprotein translocase SecE subunit